jgi:hypothetical protein
MKRSILIAGLAVLPLGALANGNLIVNGNFQAGDTGFISDYSSQVPGPNVLFPEDTYTVDSNPNNDHSSFASFFDHTYGNADGKMMIVNGAADNGMRVWEETVTVDAGTDYDLSFWLRSCYPASPANLSFQVNGFDILGSPVQLDDGTNGWSNFASTWNSGASTSAVVRIVDLNTVASGNDFVLDDISMSQAVPEPATMTAMGLGVLALIRRRRATR